jgi:hypothetical protein
MQGIGIRGGGVWSGWLCCVLAGCGDDTRASASDGVSASATEVSATVATMTGPTTSGASDSLTGTGDSGSMSASMTDASATLPTTSLTGTGDTSASGTMSDTDGEVGFCGDDPPKGFVGPFDANCKTEPQIGTFTPVLEWNKQAWVDAPAYNQVMMTPIVATITDDDADGVYGSDGDMPAVLVIAYTGVAYQATGVLRAISGDGSKELLAVANQNIAACSGIAVGDLDGDDKPEIVVVQAGGSVAALGHDGTLKWASAAYPGDIAFSFMAAPAIADLDADGKPEVIIGRVILNNDGSLRGKGMYGTGAPTYGSTSFAADLEGDGVQEVIVGNAVYHADGSHLWSIPDADGYPAVADFDKDGGPEIVVVTAGGVRLQTAGGGVLWSVVNPAEVGGPPTIADYDGDGLPEVGVAGKAGYVVFDGDGAVLWQQATQDASSAVTGSAVYDFEGDGIADVVYADEVNLYVYSGTDGAVKLLYDGHNSGTLIEYPIVVDVDNDGQVEIVVAHNNLLQTNYGVSVIGDKDKSWRPGRKIWNQHAYNITNIGEYGEVPMKPEANWAKYNNFRSGDLSEADGLLAPDLQMLSPEGCVNECGGPDIVNIWVQLGNTGGAPLLAGAVIEVYGSKMGVESLITAVDVPGPFAPGEFLDAIVVPVVTTDLEQIRLVSKPKESECVVDMANEIVLVPPFCTVPG